VKASFYFAFNLNKLESKKGDYNSSLLLKYRLRQDVFVFEFSTCHSILTFVETDFYA